MRIVFDEAAHLVIEFIHVARNCVLVVVELLSTSGLDVQATLDLLKFKEIQNAQTFDLFEFIAIGCHTRPLVGGE